MARDFENIDDVDDLDDNVLMQFVLDRLAEHRGLDLADITVTVHDHVDALDGRVSTDRERRVAERIVTDIVSVSDVGNAIQNGTAWIPPTSPTQEGIEGEEDNPVDDADRDSY